ncbi:MAG: choice-of-anchor I family protein [Bacteroidota bacterium]
MISFTKRMLLIGAFFLLATGVAQSQVQLQLLGDYQSGVFDAGAAEITAYDAATARLFVTNAEDNTIDILDLSDPTNITLISSIDMSSYGGGVNSVATYNGMVAVAVEAEVKTDNGSVVFFDTDGANPEVVEVGPLPDMVTFSPDGTLVFVANEGEPNDDYTIDPKGGISRIDVATKAVTTRDFTAFDANQQNFIDAGVRVFGPGAVLSDDLEPEYIAISSDGNTGYIMLQENNALGIFQPSTGAIVNLVPLGFKDHSVEGNGFDASNDDDAINIQTWPTKGMYQPDGFDIYDVNGTSYLITANEGDARDYDGFTEEFRVRDLRLNTNIFTESNLQDNDQLGRLRITAANGRSADSLYFLVEADSAQEVTGGDNRGSGEGELFYNVATQTMTMTFTFEGLDFVDFNGGTALTAGDATDDVTLMHIHQGARGANGGVVFDILNDGDTNVTTDAGVTTLTSVWTQGDAAFDAFLDQMQGAILEQDVDLYLNVHTSGEPAGAIRGQLVADPLYDELFSYGARSFSIWNGNTGALVFDSGDDFETRLATLEAENFNSTNSENDSFDNRSDDKGPEPEAVTIATIGGTPYAFIALERIGGVMVYDVSDPAAPEYVSYTNSRNFDELDFNEDTLEELDDDGNTEEIAAIMASTLSSGPEDITFISDSESPTGRPLAVVANEVTGSVLAYEIVFESEAAPLFISEYAEGSSNNKYLEIYNPTDEAVNLSDYGFASVANEPEIPGQADFFNPFLEGQVIQPGDVFIWADRNADDATILAEEDSMPSAFSLFNGDDSWALVFGTADSYEILDLIGNFNERGPWDVAGIADATQNRTLVRKSAITHGNPAPLGSFGTNATDSEWIVRDQNDFTGLGSHMIDNSIRLTILHNNDGESQLVSLGDDTLSNFGGVARFKTLVDQLRDEATFPGSGALLLSSGDNFLAGPEFNAGQSDGIFYDAVALNELDYDAIALGNHDFDFGPEITADFIEAFGEDGAPFVSANLDFSNEPRLDALENEGRLASSVIVQVQNQMIGIVGATTPNLPFISAPRNVIVDNMVLEAVQVEIDALEAEGINKIILISHLQGIEEDSVLATQLSGIDVMIAGGGDELLANPGDLLIPGQENQVRSAYPIYATNDDGNQVPIVTTRGNYSYLGKLVIEFDENGDITNVIEEESGPVRVSGVGTDAVAENQDLIDEVVTPVQEFLDGLASNVIATTEVPLDGVRGNVRGRETNIGNLITDAYLAIARDRAASFGVKQPDVAVMNGGGIRNDNVIAAGGISELQTFNILPFSNFLSVVEDIPPAQFKEIMENAVSKISAETGLPAGDGTGRFAQASGFSFVYDESRRPREFDQNDNVTFSGDRILDIVLDDDTTFVVRNGQVVDGAPDVSMAIGDFNAAGGDQYPFGELGFTQLGITDQQSLALYISSGEYLDGTISEDDYPEGGRGNITRLSTPLDEVRVRQDDIRITAVGVVTRTLGGGTRIQDEYGGIFIRHTNEGNPFAEAVLDGDIRPGTVVRVTGDLSSFSGLKQINNNDVVNFEILDFDQVPPAIPLTLAEISANGEEYESRLIAVTDVTIDADGDTEFGSSSTYDIATPNDATGNVTLRIGSSGDTNLDGTTIPTTAVNFVGVLTQFNNFGNNPDEVSYQLLPINVTDLQSGFTLALLHNNDGESQLVSLGDGEEANFGGVARFRTLVDEVRSENREMGRGVLMLSSGDNFLPGPEFTVSLNDSIFYDAIAVDAIGYDALAIGNHDFDFGPDVLFEFADFVESTFLSANLDFSANDSLTRLVNEERIASSAIFNVNGQNIGIVGATTPNLPFISFPDDVEVGQDVAAAVQAEIDDLESQGVNKIILISHLQGVEEDSTLATQLSGIDIVIAGGGDELLANEGDLLIPGDEGDIYSEYPILTNNMDGDQVAIVTGPGNYAYLGQLVIEFDGAGEILSILDESGPIRVVDAAFADDGVIADPALQQFVVDPVAAGVEALGQNVIATTAVTLDAGSNDIRARETNQGNLIADGFLWQANRYAANNSGFPTADIAVANGGGIRNDDIAPGEISELTTLNMLPFSNFIAVVENVTPETFKLMMENAVSRIVLDENGAPQRQGGGTGRYAQISGFTFEYNVAETALELDFEGNVVTPGTRIIDIILDDGTAIVRDGVILENAPNVNIATADFTAQGGDQYPFQNNTFERTDVTYQQSLFNYLVAPVSEGGLEGQVTAAQYPEGGEGRIALTDRRPVSNDNTDLGLPVEFALQQNYPNPFNPTTNINFDLPEASEVRLTVYNTIGQQVMTLVNQRMNAGRHTVNFDASTLASGMYIYRIEAGSFTRTMKMMLIK